MKIYFNSSDNRLISANLATASSPETTNITLAAIDTGDSANYTGIISLTTVDGKSGVSVVEGTYKIDISGYIENDEIAKIMAIEPTVYVKNNTGNENTLFRARGVSVSGGGFNSAFTVHLKKDDVIYFSAHHRIKTGETLTSDSTVHGTVAVTRISGIKGEKGDSSGDTYNDAALRNLIANNTAAIKRKIRAIAPPATVGELNALGLVDGDWFVVPEHDIPAQQWTGYTIHDVDLNTHLTASDIAGGDVIANLNGSYYRLGTIKLHNALEAAIKIKSRITAGAVLPTNPEPQDLHIILANQTLNVKDENGAALTSVVAFDLLRWTGADWRRAGTLARTSAGIDKATADSTYLSKADASTVYSKLDTVISGTSGIDTKQGLPSLISIYTADGVFRPIAKFNSTAIRGWFNVGSSSDSHTDASFLLDGYAEGFTAIGQLRSMAVSGERYTHPGSLDSVEFIDGGRFRLIFPPTHRQLINVTASTSASVSFNLTYRASGDSFNRLWHMSLPRDTSTPVAYIPNSLVRS